MRRNVSYKLWLSKSAVNSNENTSMRDIDNSVSHKCHSILHYGSFKVKTPW